MSIKKNVIINKSALIDNFNINLNQIVLDKIKKYNEYNIQINTYSESENYDIVNNLEPYQLAIKSNLLIYHPKEFNGWYSLIDIFDKDMLNIESNLNILVDANIIGIIELIKYMRERNDTFYLNNKVADQIDIKVYEYFRKMFKININNNKTLFDLIFVTNIDIIKSYHSSLNSKGNIILLNQISELDNQYIEKINNLLKLFNQIEIISPYILKSSGEFIIIFSKPKNDHIIKENFGNLMLKVEDFFKYHLNRLIKQQKSKLHILNISNQDLRLKIAQKYQTKILGKLINLFTQLNIPLNTNQINYYNQKLITINQKLYSSLNVISYQFINYEDLKIEFNNKLELKRYTNLHNISANLSKVKRAIDTRYLKKWQFITFQLDNLKSLGKYVSTKYKIFDNTNIIASNAFLKIYEMLITYPLINNNNKLKSFHFCEAPGMFIVGLNHYIQTRTQIKDWSWYGNSLSVSTSKTALTDLHGLINKYKDKWLIGPESDGDIRTLKNIDYFKEIIGEVDLITSDCGICVEISDLNQYEEQIAETDYAQFYNMINLLKIGGSGLIKTFIPLELASNVCVIYTLTQLFEKVYICKPITSRPQNSEVYLICLNYQGINKELQHNLRSLLDKKINPKFNPNYQWIKDIPITFISQLEDYIIDITRQQISYLLNIFHFVDNTSELDKIKLLKEDKLKSKTNQYWCNKFNMISNNGTKLL